MLTLLHELSTTSEPLVRAEIKATLMYSFCAAVMPAYCYDRYAVPYCNHELPLMDYIYAV